MEDLHRPVCGKPETYEERKARREADINTMKDVLEVSESEGALVQASVV